MYLKLHALHEFFLQLPNQSPLNALLPPRYTFFLYPLLALVWSMEQQSGETRSRKRVLKKAAYCRCIHTGPVHISNYEGSEKICSEGTS